jgi:hypothetical protein
MSTTSARRSPHADGGLDRRRLLTSLPLAGLVGTVLPPAAVVRAQAPPANVAAASPRSATDWFPKQDLALAKEVVGVSHRDLKRVRELVERHPSLARASWDWGFGDWETALGAASHVGRREIAEFLIANGAQPSLFSATMLGQLPVVRAFVESSPGIQRTLGPHAITLLSHARAGGAAAAEVLKYLQTVGGADAGPTLAPLTAAERDAVIGRYDFGPGPRDRFDVDVQSDMVGMTRPGDDRQIIRHTGDLVFFPSGVPSVRVAFVKQGPGVVRLTIADPEVFLTAQRA